MVELDVSELDVESCDIGTCGETAPNPEESLGIGPSLLFIRLLTAGTWVMFAAACWGAYWMAHKALA